MSQCPCCGAQEAAHQRASALDHAISPRIEPHGAAGDLMADESIAKCCQLAQQTVAQRGASTVEVADFLTAMTIDREGRDALHAAGLNELDVLAHATGPASGASSGRHRAGGIPVFSQDLLVLLERAEAHARRSGASSVTLLDFGQVLAHESGDLIRAPFLQQAHAARGGGHGQRDGAWGLRHAPRGRDERTAVEGFEARSRALQRSAAPATMANDPFQLRVDVGCEAVAAASLGQRFSDAEGTPPAPDVRAREGARPATAACDTRHLERQLHELAAASDAASRESAQLRAVNEARLDVMSRDIQALKAMLRDAFARLEGRLSDLSVARQRRDRARGGDGDGDRLMQIETALKRLEATMARQNGAQSAGSRREADSSRQARSPLHAFDHADTRDRDGDGDTERTRDHGHAGSRRRSRSRIRNRLSNLSRRRRHRVSRRSRSSQSSRSSRHSQSANAMRGPHESGSQRALDRDRARETRRPDRDRDIVALDDDAGEGDPATKRFYLSMSDDIVAAPSIGPRTASRLQPHGIMTVADLLAADAADLAERIDIRYITTQTIEDWQMQARLVCTIPWLRGTHAQLLVGSGYTSAGSIVEASGADFSADILKFASTRDGQRILRNGPPPALEKIAKWAEFAALAELDRAA